MMDDRKKVSLEYVESYKNLSIEDKKKELLEKIKSRSEGFRELCSHFFGIDERFVIDKMNDNYDIMNEDEFLNAMFYYLIELDTQVDIIMENVVE